MHRQEDRLSERERSGPGHAEVVLERLDRVDRRAAEVVGGGAQLGARRVAERDEVAVQLLDIRAPHSVRQRAVERHLAAQQDHGSTVDAVEHAALGDDLTD